MVAFVISEVYKILTTKIQSLSALKRKVQTILATCGMGLTEQSYQQKQNN